MAETPKPGLKVHAIINGIEVDVDTTEPMPESALALDGFNSYSPEYLAKLKKEAAPAPNTVPCPVCGVDAGRRCIGLVRGAVHAARIG